MYKKDACALLAIHKELPNVKINVSKWKSIILQSAGNAGLMISSHHENWHFEFEQVGKYFVEQLLKIWPEQSAAKSPPFLMEKAAEYVATLAADEEFRAYCRTKHPDEAAHVKWIVNAAVAQRVDAALHQWIEDGTVAVAADATAANESDGTAQERQEERPPKRAKTGDNKSKLEDLDDRHTLKELLTSPVEKITCMQKIMARIKEASDSNRPLKMTSGAKSFVSRSLGPPLRCLEAHFKGDVEAFCQKYPNFNHTTFVKGHCCPWL